MISGVRASSTRIEFDLVDDREGVAALDHLPHVVFHVVAQIVEAELVVRAVCDVGGIGLTALIVVKPVHDHADGHAEELVNLPHPLRVAACEIVVDGDDMHALAAERVEIDGGGRDKGLAFAGAHLRDRALVQDQAADQLDVEVALLEGALGGFAHRRKSAGGQVVNRLTGGEFGPKLVGLRAELLVGQRFEFGLERVDRGDHRAVALEAAVVGRTENPFHYGVDFQGAEHLRPFQSRLSKLSLRS